MDIDELEDGVEIAEIPRSRPPRFVVVAVAVGIVLLLTASLFFARNVRKE